MPTKDKEKQHEYRRRHYLRHKKQVKAEAYAAKRRLKDDIRALKQKFGCCVCGEKESCCLDFHHLVKEEKRECIARLVNSTSRKRAYREIEKCVILCSNCHRKFHAGLVQPAELESSKLRISDRSRGPAPV